MSKQLFYRSESVDDVWVHCGTKDEALTSVMNMMRTELDELFANGDGTAEISLTVKEMTDDEVAAIPDM